MKYLLYATIAASVVIIDTPDDIQVCTVTGLEGSQILICN